MNRTFERTMLVVLVLLVGVAVVYAANTVSSVFIITLLDYGQGPCVNDDKCSTGICIDNTSLCGCINDSACPSGYTCSTSNLCLQPRVTTDSPLYSPGVDVVMEGFDFVGNITVNLTIYNSSGSLVFQSYVDSALNGFFQDVWSVSLSQDDNYTVYATDTINNVTVNTTFTVLQPYQFLGLVLNESAALVNSTTRFFLAGTQIAIDDEDFNVTFEYGRKYDIVVIPANVTPIINLTVRAIINQGDNSTIIYLGQPDESVTSFAEFYELFSYDVNVSDFDFVTFNLNVTPGTTLFKCTSWDFFNQVCTNDNDWGFAGLSFTELATITLYKGDPGIGFLSGFNLVEIPDISCIAEDSEGTAGAWNDACADPTGGNLQYDDALLETHTYRKNTVGGVRVNATNTSITDCASIVSVEFCYEWWADSVVADCDISIDADDGASFTPVTTDCPSTLPNPGMICLDVTNLESWVCDDFFGTGGMPAQIKSELTTGLNGGNRNAYWDVLGFNVVYDTGTGTTGTGGGSPRRPLSPCIDNWQCTDWGVCLEGMRSRECLDVNHCGREYNRPPEQKSCYCINEWGCDDWSACTGTSMSRSCTPIGDCYVNAPQPVTQKECVMTPEEESAMARSRLLIADDYAYYVILALIPLLILLLLYLDARRVVQLTKKATGKDVVVEVKNISTLWRTTVSQILVLDINSGTEHRMADVQERVLRINVAERLPFHKVPVRSAKTLHDIVEIMLTAKASCVVKFKKVQLFILKEDVRFKRLLPWQKVEIRYTAKGDALPGIYCEYLKRKPDTEDMLKMQLLLFKECGKKDIGALYDELSHMDSVAAKHLQEKIFVLEELFREP